MMMKYKKDIKVVIMSATLDHTLFQDYYKGISRDIPFIEIPWRSYPIDKHYDTCEMWYEELVQYYFSQGLNIYLYESGKKEIGSQIAKFSKMLWHGNVFPLHAERLKSEQDFLMTNDTWKPRLIVGTNIWEESITIPYLDVIIDLWTHKVLFVNKLWIPELRRTNTSKANVIQRSWRVWRVKPGISHRDNDVPFEELDDYPTPPIQKEMLDRYILALLATGVDIRQKNKEEKLQGRRLFIHDLNPTLLNLSYQRLYEIGAIDGRDRITDLGLHLLNFPLDVYNARMLQESIERKCSKKVMMMVAILEKKWFLSKDDGGWKKLKVSLKNESDLFGYVELYQLFTSKKLKKEKISQLISLWIDEDELEDFESQNSDRMLFECVDLSPIWVKNKKLAEIYYLVKELEARMERIGEFPTDEGEGDDIKISLLAGNLHNIFEYCEKSRKFKNIDHAPDDDSLDFQAWNVSQMAFGNGKLYIGQPFIIWWNDGKQDLNLLTYITAVDEGHIDDLRLTLKSKQRDYVPTSWTTEQSERVYASFVEWYGKRKFDSSAQSQEYYTKYGLVDYLVSQNQVIRKYLKWKNGDEIGLFRQLLQKHIWDTMLDLVHRTNPRDLADTQRRYEHDTQVLESFQQSRDPLIVAWRWGRWIETVQKLLVKTSAIPIKPSGIASVDASKKEEDFQVKTLREKYSKLVKGYKGVRERKYRKGFKRRLADEIIVDLQSTCWDYNQLLIMKDQLDRNSIDEVVHVLLKDIKSSLKKQKALDTAIKTQRYFQSVLAYFEKLLDNVKPQKQVPFDTIYRSRKLDTSQKRKLRNFLNYALSDDRRQRKRYGRTFVEEVLPTIERESKWIDAEVERLKSIVNLSHINIAFTIKSHLEKVLQNLFEDQYYRLMIQDKTPHLVQEVLRDSISQNPIGIEWILVTFLEKTSMAHTHSKKPVHELYQTYINKLEQLEVYATVIQDAVFETEDMTYIQEQLLEVQRIKWEVEALEYELSKKGY